MASNSTDATNPTTNPTADARSVPEAGGRNPALPDPAGMPVSSGNTGLAATSDTAQVSNSVAVPEAVPEGAQRCDLCERMVRVSELTRGELGARWCTDSKACALAENRAIEEREFARAASSHGLGIQSREAFAASYATKETPAAKGVLTDPPGPNGLTRLDVLAKVCDAFDLDDLGEDPAEWRAWVEDFGARVDSALTAVDWPPLPPRRAARSTTGMPPSGGVPVAPAGREAPEIKVTELAAGRVRDLGPAIRVVAAEREAARTSLEGYSSAAAISLEILAAHHVNAGALDKANRVRFYLEALRAAGCLS